MSNSNELKEYFADQEIFITGATGLIGKVLVEKLLRSCEKVKKIYLLIREKKKLSFEDRLKEFKNSRVFDLIKNKNPNLLDKLEGIPGDIIEIGLGLSEESLQLMKNVNIIYHVAATIRFDEQLKYAILLNVRGTREILNFASSLKNLKLCVHVSTAYCNPYENVINEEVYAPKADWRKTIKMAEKYDETTLNILCEKFIKNFPNTYTMTKHLAEQVALEFYGEIPIIIVRPTIVHAASSEPFEAWFDNFSGIMAIVAMGYAGLVHLLYCNPNVVLDLIPLDMCVKLLLICPWWYETQERKKVDTIQVFNAACSNIKALTIGNMVKCGENEFTSTAYEKNLWYPTLRLTECKYNFWLQIYLFHLFPSIFLDGLCRLFNYPEFFVKLQRKNVATQTVLRFFVFKTYKFETSRLNSMIEKFRTSDEFEIHKAYDYEENKLTKLALLGARRYLLNEDDKSLPIARKRLKIKKYVHYTLKYLSIIGITYIFLYRKLYSCIF